MARHLTRELFEKLKHKKTQQGFTIARAVNTGVKNKNSITGCHAGDEESYTTFADFFDQVIFDYHGGYKPSDTHKTDLDPSHLKGKIANPSKIISTRVRVARNIRGFNLAPNQKDKREKEEIESLMKRVFEKLEGDLKGTYYPLLGMSEDDRRKLIEDHFLFKGEDKMQADSGYHMWWPHGRGIYLNDAKTFVMWLNEGDHLRIISLQKGGDISAVFERLSRAICTIEKFIKEIDNREFQSSDHLGMITCCPTNLGTGLRGSVLIGLPNVIAKMGEEGLKKWCGENHLQARGFYGEHSKVGEGCIYDISNKYRLGYSEVQLVQFMIDGVNALSQMEDK